MRTYELIFQGYDPKRRPHLRRVVKAPHLRAVDLFLSYQGLKSLVQNVVEGPVADAPEYGQHWLADGVHCIINVRGAVIAQQPQERISEWAKALTLA